MQVDPVADYVGEQITVGASVYTANTPNSDDITNVSISLRGGHDCPRSETVLAYNSGLTTWNEWSGHPRVALEQKMGI